MNNIKKKIKVVIVGGGFGGVYTAINLNKLFKKNEVDIVLINKSNYFLFTPLLHEVATGALNPINIVESIREVFRGTSVNIVENTVNEIDSKNRLVMTDHTSYEYDYLVVSTGAETNYFNTPGARELCFSLKDLQDAVAIRNHIINTCEIAVQTKNKDLLNTSIIGAGPTGVELAAEFMEYMRHTLCTYYSNSGFTKEDIKVNLITGTPDVIPQFPPKMRELALKELQKKGINVITNTMVMSVEPNVISFKDGDKLKSHTIVWVAGVCPTAHDIKGMADLFSISKNLRLDVNEFLQSTKDPSIFALGDTSGNYPMLAQVAVQQGKSVAYNIYNMINHIEPRPFIFKQKGLLISLGHWYAIGNIGGFTFSGKIMWLVWRLAYLFNFISWRKKFEIISEWTANMFYPREISYLK